MYIYAQLPPKDLNSNFYLLYITNTYTCVIAFCKVTDYYLMLLVDKK